MDLGIDIGNKGIMTFAPGILEPIVSLAVSYCGDLAAGEIVLKPLRSFRRPLADTIRAMPYVQMQSLSGIGPLAELGALLGSDDSRTGFIERLSEQAIDIIIASLAARHHIFGLTAEHYLHGAICRPAPNHAAFHPQRWAYSAAMRTVCAN